MKSKANPDIQTILTLEDPGRPEVLAEASAIVLEWVQLRQVSERTDRAFRPLGPLDSEPPVPEASDPVPSVWPERSRLADSPPANRDAKAANRTDSARPDRGHVCDVLTSAATSSPPR
jgi:hypothetical protein